MILDDNLFTKDLRPLVRIVYLYPPNKQRLHCKILDEFRLGEKQVKLNQIFEDDEGHTYILSKITPISLTSACGVLCHYVEKVDTDKTNNDGSNTSFFRNLWRNTCQLLLGIAAGFTFAVVYCAVLHVLTLFFLKFKMWLGY